MAYTTIDNPELYFQVVTWTGNATDDRTITLPGDTDMQPDLVWAKERSSTSGHIIVDAVRGATKFIQSHNTTGEDTGADIIQAFESDGFQIGTHGAINENTETYVAWCWKANGSGSSNTDGSINTASTSANTTSGFSINTFTGTQNVGTIGHGLGAKPAWIVVKNTADSSDAWYVYHQGIASDAETDYIILNTTGAAVDYNTPWNDTAPTSSVFTVGADGGNNESGSTMVAYCFAEKQGFSKFGSYTGNNNSDGAFVYTGFRPAWVMIKMSDSTKSWQIYDNKRFTSNPINAYLTLNADTSAAESYGTVYPIDFLSNGFKFHTDTSEVNASNTYIYMAFAEAPFVNSNGVPCNAR